MIAFHDVDPIYDFQHEFYTIYDNQVRTAEHVYQLNYIQWYLIIWYSNAGMFGIVNVISTILGGVFSETMIWKLLLNDPSHSDIVTHAMYNL